MPSNATLTDGTYTISDNVNAIRLNAIKGMTGLKKVVFPKNLKSIETGWPTIVNNNGALEYAIADGGTTTFKVIDGVLFDGSELVLYPSGKTTTAYTMPDGITSIAPYAISNVDKMTSIDLNQVSTLAISALFHVNQLKTITLPKDMTNEGMSQGCFENCTSVAEYIVPEENAYLKSSDGIVFSKDMTTLYFYPPAKAGTSYTIPSTVTTVGKRAFQSAKKLTEITVPKSVTTVNDEGFREMTNLTKVTFEEPSSLTTFGSGVFWTCTALKEITLPTALTEIGEGLFQDCKVLETIHIPDGSNLQTIAANAFTTNANLSSIDFQGSCALTTIGSNAFANLKKITSFSFPKSVTTIENNAFIGCSNMTTATFADNAEISTLGSGAFADCGLTSVSLPASLKEIDKEAFRNCKVLTTVNVPATTTKISPEAFKYCEKLTDIHVDRNNTAYSSSDGILLTKDKKTLVLFPEGKANKNFTLLPPSITKIGDYAFYDCAELENVTIPNKVTSIGKRAFGLCTKLTTITFLCDEMINPKNINQEKNDMSIDDGTNVADKNNMFKNINIYVRKDLKDQYEAQDYYNKFKSIGTSFTDGTGEYIPVSDNAVDLLSTTTTDYTYVVPTTASDGKNSYTVSLVGDYAFQNVGNTVHEVVVHKGVGYLGAKAFMTNIKDNTSSIENVFFLESKPTKEMLSTTRFALDETGDNYNEFASTTKIYVKKSALETYQNTWPKFTSQLGYKIPGVTISHRYGTFAREFDADFSEYANDHQGKSPVAAFVAGSGILEGTGDYGTTTYHVHMTSVDENGGYSSYSYVPAYTGVLLKVLDGDKTGDDFYYTIGEHDDQTYTIKNNIMHGVTVNAEKVEASAASPVYVMQGGIFRKATVEIPAFTVHKAYMKTPEKASKAKLVFDVDDSQITGIDTINTDAQPAEDDAYYSVDGVRVDKPSKGIFIHQGKKVLFK